MKAVIGSSSEEIQLEDSQSIVSSGKLIQVVKKSSLFTFLSSLFQLTTLTSYWVVRLTATSWYSSRERKFIQIKVKCQLLETSSLLFTMLKKCLFSEDMMAKIKCKSKHVNTTTLFSQNGDKSTIWKLQEVKAHLVESMTNKF